MKLLAPARVVPALLLMLPVAILLVVPIGAYFLMPAPSTGLMAAPATPQPPLVAYHHTATVPVVELHENDVICEISNGLADRMQHDGWVETLIQSKLPEKKLVFRNLSFTGDTVTSARAKRDSPPPRITSSSARRMSSSPTSATTSLSPVKAASPSSRATSAR